MKQLHRSDLFCWSAFNPERNLDFHSVLWLRPEGNVLIDPLPLSTHDQQHLKALGGAKIIIITNSDHCRDAAYVAKISGAAIYGPAAERKAFPLPCQQWLSDKQEIVPGLIAFELRGSKTLGELALVLEHSTLITGDLIRGHVAGELCLLPNGKLADIAAAKASVQHLASFPGIDTVLVGDGWHVFKNGGDALMRLAKSF
jgi:hypothetical protein